MGGFVNKDLPIVRFIRRRKELPLPFRSANQQFNAETVNTFTGG